MVEKLACKPSDQGFAPAYETFSVELCGTEGGGLREVSDGKEVRDAKSELRHAKPHSGLSSSFSINGNSYITQWLSRLLLLKEMESCQMITLLPIIE